MRFVAGRGAVADRPVRGTAVAERLVRCTAVAELLLAVAPWQSEGADNTQASPRSTSG